MATEERLPPACAFAVSVLAERNQDPDAVPEEAVEAAQQHIASCPRCIQAAAPQEATPRPRRKRKTRRVAEATSSYQTTPAGLDTLLHETAPLIIEREKQALIEPSQAAIPTELASISDELLPIAEGVMTCQQCRQLLPEYAEAMDSGQNIAALYPDVQEHILSCDAGCLVLLDLLKQEAKATRKYRRRPVRDPFRAMYWILTGFFRGGQLPIAPMALSYGALILIILFASLSTYLGINWHESIYHPPPTPVHLIPTPDGIGISDGLKIYDACNAQSYQAKREAAQAMQKANFAQADKLLQTATSVVQNDTTGCNGAEAAIYRENLHVRQSGRPFSIVVVSFDSGPGNADPHGGTDRHRLYAAYTQELVGAFISQQQYNARQMQAAANTPLLYLVLANTTGAESGALEVANTISSILATQDLKHFGLLANNNHPVLAVLGLGPSSMTQIVLPVLCRAGVPLIAPTAMGPFITDLVTQTSLYRHCAPGFAFIRFSPDDAAQSALGASYAYKQLHTRNVAAFYDPANPSSKGSADSFVATFSKFSSAHIVARETVVASNQPGTNGGPQAARDDLLAGLKDALQAKPRPDLIFAPLRSNDVVTLAQAIAKLPQKEQPVLMIGGEFVQPQALQGLVQWSRQQQLTMPRVYIALSSAARPPTNGDWQKQFYATFCTSFATPGSFCSGTAALDQGALFFADGIEIVASGIGPITDKSKIPTPTALVKNISAEQFAGVSGPIAFQSWNNVLLTSTKSTPVMLSIQQDGSIQIVG